METNEIKPGAIIPPKQKEINKTEALIIIKSLCLQFSITMEEFEKFYFEKVLESEAGQG